MVLKPSEVAPLSAIVFSEIMDEAGVPKGVYNMVNGDGPTVGEAMSKHKDKKFILNKDVNCSGMCSTFLKIHLGFNMMASPSVS